jgi:hypothetical protein
MQDWLHALASSFHSGTHADGEHRHYTLRDGEASSVLAADRRPLRAAWITRHSHLNKRQHLLGQSLRALERDIVYGVEHTHDARLGLERVNVLQAALAQISPQSAHSVEWFALGDDDLERAMGARVEVQGGLLPHGLDDLQVVLETQARQDGAIGVLVDDVQNAGLDFGSPALERI